MAVTLLLAAFAAAPAEPQPPMPPTKRWVVDYAETYCTATREYGDSAKPLQLVLRPSPRNNLLQIFVIGPGRREGAQHVSASYQFAGRTFKTTALLYGSKTTPQQVLLATLGADALGGIAGAREVRVHADHWGAKAFAIPTVGNVMTALTRCNADLQAHWNLSAAAQEKIATPAQPLLPLSRYFSSGDYPWQAIREQDGGNARVTLLIDEEGKVRDCLLEETSGNASLDAMTCIVLRQRAKFHPARDVGGKAMKSVVSQGISWRVSAP
ncbi:MAG TPA: TonB family protein [Allosphingosinicella sp.]